MPKVYSTYKRRMLKKISTRYKSKVKCTKNIMHLLDAQDEEKHTNLMRNDMNMIIRFYDILLKEHNNMREIIREMQKSISELRSKVSKLER